MAERGEMIVLHEPFCNLRDYGQADAGARTFDSPLSLLAWLREPGERPEWHRSARWHADVSASSGFERCERVSPHTVENSADLAGSPPTTGRSTSGFTHSGWTLRSPITTGSNHQIEDP